MKLVDMHCDTIFELYRRGDMNLKQNTLCVDLEKMKCAGSIAQFFACFIQMKMFQGQARWSEGYEYAKNMIAYARAELKKHPVELSFVQSYHELLKNEMDGKISAFLTVEEGGILDGKMERLEELYDQGIRLITLTWNEENCLGFPNSRDGEVMKKGLKPFGVEAIERMNELGIIIDVSHMSDGGFWGAIYHSKKPVVASHSNARELCHHPRNLSDDMIRALAEKGGIAGINFYPYFLNQSGKANMNDLIHHIEHMYRLGGEDFVAIGTDFDGFDQGELDLQHLGQIEQLYEGLKRHGFGESQMEKFWHKNAMRVIKDVL